ncbi:DUF6252 family protein [Flavobacterium sp. 5]|uniref:DUF6252 family protein n=1 Tax=Flavobacterium sp. 5 TaxID=2035199 RepID=UPI000C2C3B75|nr:DUF6252 family protein [Flavobacterium sp. 5]PKB17048.1 hypothetical protein CLU82_2216 [Flavobacterium sp. 5]
MRSFFLVIVLFFVLTSCEDQVKFNNPAFQGLKDNVLWRSTLFSAVQAPDGSLEIKAYQNRDILYLNTVSTAVKTYKLGIDDINSAKLEEIQGDIATFFSTGENKGDGQIIITEFDAVNHTISGEFKFNAEGIPILPLSEPNVSFTKGIFYKVPVTIATK